MLKTVWRADHPCHHGVQCTASCGRNGRRLPLARGRALPRAAMAFTAGSDISPPRSGLYAWYVIAWARQKAIVASSWEPTLSLHWLTAGVTVAVASSAVSSEALKFDTPIARV